MGQHEEITMKTTHKDQQTGKQAFLQIIDIVTDYFDGLYHADVEKLRSIFHTDSHLQAANMRKDLDTWLTAVASRAVPAKENHAYKFQIISIEVIGNEAMVKVQCPLFAFNYVDYLGLLRENGRWQIVNKMFADTELN